MLDPTLQLFALVSDDLTYFLFEWSYFDADGADSCFDIHKPSS